MEHPEFSLLEQRRVMPLNGCEISEYLLDFSKPVYLLIDDRG